MFLRQITKQEFNFCVERLHSADILRATSRKSRVGLVLGTQAEKLCGLGGGNHWSFDQLFALPKRQILTAWEGLGSVYPQRARYRNTRKTRADAGACATA